ncbi:hypothetical protein AWY96_15645 [Serratia plymuthica]|uniref:DUF943 family protein n=2 Tax=Serratia plymuthica TaxID=82996 RepID=A0A2X4U2P4_SERPL|nr:DUF943 family protein [Serratia plymuthica]KYQ94834.1 hypothetical protein AWY96_15645 [Serratia plymuthica]QPS21944.1 DUF943 family protein [Serratia plymuthica]QPS63556.1 DUF943 family protein [Serratia plymuthica]RKS64076.1 putative membrane protein DUF943 [Serratia plymuthica]UNK26981.1 DUF943 family protein [Serratia plymuthica]
MKVKNKKTLCTLLLIVCTLLGYFFWLSLRPVEIVAVHKDGEFSSVLVKNFPFTDKGKINWWLSNKEMLKEKYRTPEPASDGFFAITFWDFGEGYKEEGKYDRRCFDDMKTKFNCIDKNRIFSIENNKKNDTFFTVHDGIYRMNKNGNIEKTYNK